MCICTVKPALVTTCIQRPPLFKDHLVMSQLWIYHAFLPLLRDQLYSKTTFFLAQAWSLNTGFTACFRYHIHIFIYNYVAIGSIPYSSKFSRSNNFVIFVRCKLITKFLSTKNFTPMGVSIRAAMNHEKCCCAG